MQSFERDRLVIDRHNGTDRAYLLLEFRVRSTFVAWRYQGLCLLFVSFHHLSLTWRYRVESFINEDILLLEKEHGDEDGLGRHGRWMNERRRKLL